jgi:hypothetical protein
MSVMMTASNTSAPTQLLRLKSETYAYRRFGSGPGRPLVCLQHFMGTLDNWIRRSPIRSRQGEKSFCSTAQA